MFKIKDARPFYGDEHYTPAVPPRLSAVKFLQVGTPLCAGFP